MSEDRELLARAREGDREALDEILRRHEPQVFRFGLRMCGDEEAAREVLRADAGRAHRHHPLAPVPRARFAARAPAPRAQGWRYRRSCLNDETLG